MYNSCRCDETLGCATIIGVMTLGCATVAGVMRHLDVQQLQV